MTFRRAPLALAPWRTAALRARFRPVVGFAQPLEIIIRVVVARPNMVALVAAPGAAGVFAYAARPRLNTTADPVPVTGQLVLPVTVLPSRHQETSVP